VNTLVRRLRKLEEDRAGQRNPQGLTLADVLRQRICRATWQRRRAGSMTNWFAKVSWRPERSGKATLVTARLLVFCGAATNIAR